MLEDSLKIEDTDRGKQPRSVAFDERNSSLSKEYADQAHLWTTEKASCAESMQRGQAAEADTGFLNAHPVRSGVNLVDDCGRPDSAFETVQDQESPATSMPGRGSSGSLQKSADFHKKAYPPKIKFDADSDDLLGQTKSTFCRSDPFLENDIAYRLYPKSMPKSEWEVKAGNAEAKPRFWANNDQDYVCGSRRKPFDARVQLIHNTFVLVFILACSAFFMLLADYDFRHLGQLTTLI